MRFFDNFRRSYRLVVTVYCAAMGGLFGVAYAVSPYCRASTVCFAAVVGFLLVGIVAVRGSIAEWLQPWHRPHHDWQVHSRLRRKWPLLAIGSVLAFPIITIITFNDLLALQTGAQERVFIDSRLAHLYELAGFWPAVLFTPALGLALLLVCLLKVRRNVPQSAPTPDQQHAEQADIAKEKDASRIIAVIKLGILCIAMVLTPCVLLPRVWREVQEPAPTRIDVDHWRQDYRGQHWLEATGYLRPELAAYTEDMQWGTRHEYIPLVGGTYKDGDEVLVIVSAPVRDTASKERVPRKSGKVTVKGLVFGPLVSPRLFPHLRVADSATYIDEGGAPSSFWPELAISAVCLLGTIFCVYGIKVVLARHRKNSPSPS